MDWNVIWGAAAGAGLVSAVATGLFSAIGWHYTRKADSDARARFLALRIAVSLEAWVAAMVQMLQDNATYVSTGGHHGNFNFSLPSPPLYPDDADAWLALDPDLANRCLIIPNRLNRAERAIEEEGRDLVGPDEDVPDSIEEMGIEIGNEAFYLSQSLRMRHRLPQYVQGAGHGEWLNKRLAQRTEARAEIDRLRAKIAADFAENPAGPPPGPTVVQLLNQMSATTARPPAAPVLEVPRQP